jgi:signal transduction histidine kinase
MQRLVWKFWIAIGLAIAAMLATSLMVVTQWQRFDSYSKAISRPHDQLEQLADQIEVSLANGDPVAPLLLDHELKHLGEVFLIGRSGGDALGRPIPDAVARGEPELAQKNDSRSGEAIFARAIWMNEERTHFMIFQFHRQHSLIWSAFQTVGLTWVLIFGLLCTGLISGLLAAIVAKPLNRLASALRRSPADCATQSIPADLLARKDEIGELARALATATSQAQTLIQKQKDFVRDVSHEVRAPLSRLQLATELVQLRPDHAQAIARIQSEVSTIDQLVDHLLKLSQAEGKALPAEASDCRITDVISTAIDRAKDLYQAKQITIRRSSPGHSSPDVFGDRILLTLVFENLLSNAIRHSPCGSEILVHVQNLASDTVITVEDEGPGVPQRDLDRIFEPFVRLDEARRRSTGNFGVGLALARRIITAHGGSVCAQSPEHQGLTVQVRLPCPQRSIAYS